MSLTDTETDVLPIMSLDRVTDTYNIISIGKYRLKVFGLSLNNLKDLKVLIDCAIERRGDEIPL